VSALKIKIPVKNLGRSVARRDLIPALNGYYGTDRLSRNVGNYLLINANFPEGKGFPPA
jgi:hypothetical protein